MASGGHGGPQQRGACAAPAVRRAGGPGGGGRRNGGAAGAGPLHPCRHRAVGRQLPLRVDGGTAAGELTFEVQGRCEIPHH